MKAIKIMFLLVMATSAFASDLPDLSKYFKDMESNEHKGVIGYEGIDVKASHIPLERAEGLGVENRENQKDQCNKEDCNVSHTFSSKATINRQDIVGSSKKGYLDKALKAVKNADKEFDYLTGSYANCESKEETVISKTETTCDQYYNMKTNTCLPRQVVEIDPKYNYVCSKKREVKEKVCIDVIKTIKCKDSKECDMGGIEPGSVDSDMKFVYENGQLTIGTISDNYWGGHCAIYDRTTSFKIKNLTQIKEFTLFEVGFDDYLLIKVNGHVVYVGPDGGNKLEVVTIKHKIFSHIFETQEVNYGTGQAECERSTNWIKQVGIDLKPYLKEGKNEIFTRTIVTGGGEGWLKIRAKQNCCTSWDITREEKCDYL